MADLSTSNARGQCLAGMRLATIVFIAIVYLMDANFFRLMIYGIVYSAEPRPGYTALLPSVFPARRRVMGLYLSCCLFSVITHLFMFWQPGPVPRKYSHDFLFFEITGAQRGHPLLLIELDFLTLALQMGTMHILYSALLTSSPASAENANSENGDTTEATDINADSADPADPTGAAGAAAEGNIEAHSQEPATRQWDETSQNTDNSEDPDAVTVDPVADFGGQVYMCPPIVTRFSFSAFREHWNAVMAPSRTLTEPEPEPEISVSEFVALI